MSQDAARAAGAARREGHDRCASVYVGNEGPELKRFQGYGFQGSKARSAGFKVLELGNPIELPWNLGSRNPGTLRGGAMNRREFLVGAGTLAIAAKPLFAAAQSAMRARRLPSLRAPPLPFRLHRNLPELGVDASGRHLRRGGDQERHRLSPLRRRAKDARTSARRSRKS